ncbi:MAG: pyruvate kinase [Candidatus Taylorbacteria bacterium]|nr:pyruvate kinase [Candidatus Taylorbacteria bacterium]
MKLGKKTKIVCTIGPATESEEMLTKLVDAGMNVMRLNFSHGDFAEHQNRVDNIRKVMKKTGKIVAVMQDLGGPKIRIGEFKDGMITLKEGQTFALTTDEILGDENRVFVNYPLLPKEVKVGGLVMLHDGTKKLEVTEIKGNDVICKVLVGGEIKGRRGVNLPGANLSISAITAKDREDLKFGIKNNVDYFALSFVRRPEDIKELREILKKENVDARIIAKIETPEALENIDAILELTDALMVARGDLAIEIPAEEVPLVQKMLITKAHAYGRPIIVATQMLESMIKTPVPTRAEVSDVANAVVDGTDAIMLSEETTLGKYPVEAVQMMTRIANRIEREMASEGIINTIEDYYNVSDVVSCGAVRIAQELGAEYIVTLSHTGRTPRFIARHRPVQQIITFTPDERVASRLMLLYGCYPVVVPIIKSLDKASSTVREMLLKENLASAGDKVVIVTGIPIGEVNETNALYVETV